VIEDGGRGLDGTFPGKRGDGAAPPSEEVDHGEAVSDLEPF
jgi:hypothetical protein